MAEHSTPSAVRVLIGVVTSSRMDKTVKVRVDRTIAHPIYAKIVRKSRFVLAHDEDNISKEGDLVVVSACRPLSKRKLWKLDEVLERSK